MLPLKLKFLPFALKAGAALFIHLYKIDILNIRTLKGSPLDANISTFIVASSVACMLAKINLSSHLQSISSVLVFILESILTIYGTEVTMYLIWLPLLKGLLWMSTQIGKTFTRSRYKLPQVDNTSCIESDLFCYLNIGLAFFIASNTLASFDWFRNLRNLWPSTADKTVVPRVDDVMTNIINPSMIAKPDPIIKSNMQRVRQKRKPILLMNVR